MRRFACLFACCLVLLPAWADPACRIAFDVGSSGIRAGSDASSATARVDIDFLGDLWADGRIDSTLPDTARALQELPRQAGFSADCARIAGGFSAWRLALEKEPGDELAATLAEIHRRSGVAVLVIPQRVEGRYGYLAAERGLEGRLRTSHILDIGGGSLQVAGRTGGWGRPLGQKAWNRLLCEKLRPGADCALPAMNSDEIEGARLLISDQLRDLAGTLPGPVTMTAISRPVSRGLFPALRRLAAAGSLPADSVGETSLNLAAVHAAIARLAPLEAEERSALSGVARAFSAYLVSDLILVEGILKAVGATRLEVAEVDITNVPGLLADDRAFAWAGRYGCYLDRLRRLGEAAYDTDPAECRPQ